MTDEAIYSFMSIYDIKYKDDWHATYVQALQRAGVPLLEAVEMTNRKPEVIFEDPLKVAMKDLVERAK